MFAKGRKIRCFTSKFCTKPCFNCSPSILKLVFTIRRFFSNSFSSLPDGYTNAPNRPPKPVHLKPETSTPAKKAPMPLPQQQKTACVCRCSEASDKTGSRQSYLDNYDTPKAVCANTKVCFLWMHQVKRVILNRLIDVCFCESPIRFKRTERVHRVDPKRHHIF